MKVRIDLPTGGSSTVELPSIPRVGDFLSLNGSEDERVVGNVVWHVMDYHPDDEAWVQVILKPTSDDLAALWTKDVK